MDTWQTPCKSKEGVLCVQSINCRVNSSQDCFNLRNISKEECNIHQLLLQGNFKSHNQYEIIT